MCLFTLSSQDQPLVDARAGHHPSSWSSARRGGVEEARLVNLARQSSAFPVLWHDQASAWLLGDVAETEQSSSVAGVRVMYLFFMLCLA